MTEKNLTVVEPRDIVNIEDTAMSVDSIVKQVQLIQDVMETVMKESTKDVDGHYGIIPGTKKKSLFKAGAEKLCLTFRLDPNYEIIREVREEKFIAYTVKCTLFHIPTSQEVASGIGSCNSRETKYRWTYLEESTGKALPKKYWDARDSGDSKEMKRILGGDGFRAAKIDGQWVIAKAEKIENDNPWDLDNTLIKMACKRALVAATLNATAASDIFTQDVEDAPKPKPDNSNGDDRPEPNRTPDQGASNSGAVGDGRLQSMWVHIKKMGWAEEDAKAWIYEEFDVSTCTTLTSSEINRAMKHFNDNPKTKTETEPSGDNPDDWLPNDKLQAIFKTSGIELKTGGDKIRQYMASQGLTGDEVEAKLERLGIYTSDEAWRVFSEKALITGETL